MATWSVGHKKIALLLVMIAILGAHKQESAFEGTG